MPAKPSLPGGSKSGERRIEPPMNTVPLSCTRCTSSFNPFGSVVCTGATRLRSASGRARSARIHAGCTTAPSGTRPPKSSLTEPPRSDGGLALAGSVVVGSSTASAFGFANTRRATAFTLATSTASISAAYVAGSRSPGNT